MKYNKNGYAKNINKDNNFQQRSKYHYIQMKSIKGSAINKIVFF